MAYKARKLTRAEMTAKENAALAEAGMAIDAANSNPDTTNVQRYQLASRILWIQGAHKYVFPSQLMLSAAHADKAKYQADFDVYAHAEGVKHARSYALGGANRYLEKMKKHAERLIEDLNRYQVQLNADNNDNVDRSDRFGWAVNEIENFCRNVGYSEATRICATLAKAFDRKDD